MPCPMTADRLLGLDALRGVAALGVVLLHLDGVFGLGWNIGRAAVAVDFFFMLSGYVMARSYESRLKSGIMPSGKFLSIRFRRLAPTLAIGTLLGFVLLLHLNGPSTGLMLALATSLMMLPAMTGGFGIYPFNGPAWSIFQEIIANILHAVLFAKMRSSLILGFAIASSIGLYFVSEDLGRTPRGTLEPVLSILRVLPSYLIGITLCRRVENARANGPEGFKVPFACALICIPAYVAFAGGLPSSVAILLFIWLLAPMMILGGLTYRGPARPAWFLGAISYPIYALHMPIIKIADHLGMGPAIALLLAFFAAAILLVPTRFLRQIWSLISGKPAPAQTA